MSRRMRTTIVILAGLLALTPLCLIGLSGQAAEEATRLKSESRLLEDAIKIVPEEKVYLVKAHDFHVAVYNWETQDAPVEVTDIDTRLMRRADRERMERGVQVTGDETLAQFLEDFLP